MGAGFFAGGVGGLAAHHLAGGKMTLPIFLVAYVLLLGGLKPWWAKIVGLIVFTAVASLIVVVLGWKPQG